MLHSRIDKSTHVLGRDQGYKPLYIRRTQVTDPHSKAATFLQESAWTPTPKEMEMLLKGASIHVGLLSTNHPPIKVTVGPIPDDAIET